MTHIHGAAGDGPPEYDPLLATPYDGEDDEAYEVGFCRPPVEHRFRPGQSGNPSGRRRKPPRDAEEILIECMMRMVKVQTAEGMRRVTCYEAMLRSLFVQAMRGDMTAMKLIVALMTKPPQLRDAAAVQARVQAQITAQRQADIAGLF